MLLILLMCLSVCAVSGQEDPLESLVASIKRSQTAWYTTPRTRLKEVFGSESIEDHSIEELTACQGCKDVFQKAEDAMDDFKDFKAVEVLMRDEAKRVFDINKKKLGDIYCEEFEDFRRYIYARFYCLSSEARAFLLILCYLDIADIPLNNTSRVLGKKPFTGMPGEFEDILSQYFRLGENAKCAYRSSLEFTYLEFLKGIQKGNLLFCLSNNLSHPEKVGVHGRKSVGFLYHFRHDWFHAMKIARVRSTMNAIQPGLYQEFVQYLLLSIEHNWPQTGVQDTIATFSLLHEDNVLMPLPSKFLGGHIERFFKRVDCLLISDPGIKEIVGDVSHKKGDDAVTQELNTWKNCLLQEFFNKHSDVDARVGQKLVYVHLQQSWFMEGCDKFLSGVVLCKRIVCAIIDDCFRDGLLSYEHMCTIKICVNNKFVKDRTLFLRVVGDISTATSDDPNVLRLPTREVFFVLGSNSQNSVLERDDGRHIGVYRKRFFSNKQCASKVCGASALLWSVGAFPMGMFRHNKNGELISRAITLWLFFY